MSARACIKNCVRLTHRWGIVLRAPQNYHTHTPSEKASKGKRNVFTTEIMTARRCSHGENMNEMQNIRCDIACASDGGWTKWQVTGMCDGTLLRDTLPNGNLPIFIWNSCKSSFRSPAAAAAAGNNRIDRPASGAWHRLDYCSRPKETEPIGRERERE